MELWIARDESGGLYVYRGKPDRSGISFEPQHDGDFMRLPDDYYPEVTWENSPQRLVLNNEKQ